MATQTEATRQGTSPENMRIGLFIPCYIDLIYPEVGVATLELLERFGLDVGYPLNQTCCGQPMSNSGDEVNAAAAERLFIENFKGYDCIVGPAGSPPGSIWSSFKSTSRAAASSRSDATLTVSSRPTM